MLFVTFEVYIFISIRKMKTFLRFILSLGTTCLIVDATIGSYRSNSFYGSNGISGSSFGSWLGGGSTSFSGPSYSSTGYGYSRPRGGNSGNSYSSSNNYNTRPQVIIKPVLVPYPVVAPSNNNNRHYNPQPSYRPPSLPTRYYYDSPPSTSSPYYQTTTTTTPSPSTTPSSSTTRAPVPSLSPVFNSALDCSSGNSRFRHETACDRFWQCPPANIGNAGASLVLCPRGQIFDVDFLQCLDPLWGKCQEQPLPATTARPPPGP